MLTNYDAKGVAELLGLAFHLQPGMSGGSILDASGVERIVHVDAAAVTVELASSRGSGDHASSLLSPQPAPPTPILIEWAVEQGLPRATLRHVAEWLAGGDKAMASLLERGVIPKTTLERRGARLSPQESERTERIARLSVHARRALGTEAEAREFMMTPHPELDNRSPVDAARTDLGTRRAEQLLNALEYGLAL